MEKLETEEAVEKEEAAVPVISRVNWRGGLPVLVEAAAEDYESQPLPVFLYVNRQTYLAYALAPVVVQFKKLCVVPEPMQHIWFSFQGMTINWQFPTGVIFDTLSDQRATPFRIIVHFRSPNAEEKSSVHRLAFPDFDTLRKSFFHWFKQGMYLRFASKLPFTELREEDDKELWESVAAGNLEMYWRVVQRMKAFSTKSFPVRIMFTEQSTSLGSVKHLVFKQVGVPVANGQRSVLEIIRECLPGLPEPAQEDTGIPMKSSVEPQILCSGILVPLDATVEQLYERLSHADMFLYFSVIKPGL